METKAPDEELERKVGERTRQLLDAQDELMRNEKLAVLTRLAGVVGHELRNPLGVISNALYYLKIMLPDADEKVAEYLNIIKNETAFAQQTLSDLLEFSRIKAPRKDRIAVRELVNRSLVKCSVPENIGIQTDVPEEFEMSVDPLQMVHVFQNLIMNAIQAMPEGGSLRISARRCTMQDSRSMMHETGLRTQDHEPIMHPVSGIVHPDGDFVEISVLDTGKGISPENIENLFQPLFSTKARGIGIGLTVSKRLAEGNGGRLCLLDSAVGKGSTFVVILPSENGTR